MLSPEYTRVRDIVRNLRVIDLMNPQYTPYLIQYAGELAPPCVAESIMQKMRSVESSLKHSIEEVGR